MSTIASAYPGVRVHGLVGDFERHLPMLPSPGAHATRLVAFLGGTIGNLAPAERAKFLNELAGALSEGEYLLLGTDLVKDRDRLVAAYDDAAGVTAEFNRNVLAVINRSLDGRFRARSFRACREVERRGRVDRDAAAGERSARRPDQRIST